MSHYDLQQLKRPRTEDQALEWHHSAAGQTMAAAIALSQQLDNAELQPRIFAVLTLAFEAGFYLGLSDPLEPATGDAP